MPTDSRSRCLIVALGGVFCFCLGALLRFEAVAVGTATIRGGNPFGNMNTAVVDSARANALYDVAVPLLWVGGALVVTAAVVFLVPAWRSCPNGVRDASAPAV